MIPSHIYLSNKELTITQLHGTGPAYAMTYHNMVFRNNKKANPSLPLHNFVSLGITSNFAISLTPQMNIHLRAPGQTYPMQIEVMDDTGCSAMKIHRPDLNRLMRMNHTPNDLPPVMGVSVFLLANGAKDYTHVIELEVNIFDKWTHNQPAGAEPKDSKAEVKDDCTGFVLPEYEKIQVCVHPDMSRTGICLGGPWIRHRFFTSTIPNGNEDQHQLYASDDPNYYESLPKKHNPDGEIALPDLKLLLPPNMFPMV
jgi:hypothetical protein